MDPSSIAVRSLSRGWLPSGSHFEQSRHWSNFRVFYLLFQGLFTADQQLEGDSSIYTRQNPQGTRRGYECPEERDHYPYWHPTEWKDIAVLTSDTSRCAYYKKESFNVNPKGKVVGEPSKCVCGGAA